MRRAVGSLVVIAWGLAGDFASADTTTFFAPCQVADPVSSDVTSDTITSNGYRFTYTRDKLFTGGTGVPIGRPVRVPWPEGVEAQAVTTPPPGVFDYKARIILARVDGGLFDLPSFSVKLLANTAGAGGALEIMPLINGEDAFPDPLYFDVTGYYGNVFHYDTSPNPLGSTALLTGFDTYKMTLYVDYALVSLTLASALPGPRSCCLPGGACIDATADACAAQGGAAQGAGTSCACEPCVTAPGPPPAPDGANGTLPLRADNLDAAAGSIQVNWDASSCPAPDYNLLYGDLSNVSSYALGGASCSMGTTGSHTWTGVPAGDLYFLLVGADGVGSESSWGRDGAGQERNGPAASGLCGATVKNLAATCP